MDAFDSIVDAEKMDAVTQQEQQDIARLWRRRKNRRKMARESRRRNRGE